MWLGASTGLGRTTRLNTSPSPCGAYTRHRPPGSRRTPRHAPPGTRPPAHQPEACRNSWPWCLPASRVPGAATTGNSSLGRRRVRALPGSGSVVPAHTVGMPVRLHHIVVDAHDLPRLARFWTQALGWKILSEREREIVIGTDENAPVGICFMPSADAKTVKNRVHLDLTSSAADRDQEIDRLLALGARRADIGQTGAESWTVLADPEGNEFCVVRPKETLTG